MALSPLEAVSIFEASHGKKFGFQLVPLEALRAQKDAAQDSISESFAALILSFAQGSDIDMNDISDIFPIQLTSVNDYAKNLSASI